MKDFSLLVWITQLGFSVAFPLAGFILLGVWLHNSCGWGGWVIWAGVILGVSSAVEGLRASVKAMKLLKDNDQPPPLAFNDHQ